MAECLKYSNVFEDIVINGLSEDTQKLITPNSEEDLYLKFCQEYKSCLKAKKSSKELDKILEKILKKNNVNVTIRREFGGNISAACGQLRSKKEEL